MRALLGAQFLAQAADGLAQAVFADVLILEPLSAGTPERIFTLFSLTLLPYSLIAPFLGVFVDRWRRRSVLIGANLTRALVLVSFPLWEKAISGEAGLYAAVLVLLGFGRLFLTTKGALLPVVLHERTLLRGNAFSSGGGMISALLGGVVGVGLVGVAPATFALVVAGIAYAVSAAIASRLSQPFAHPHPPDESILQGVARIGHELTEGLGLVWRRVAARLPLTSIFVLRCIGMFVAIGAILIIKDLYPGSGDDTIRRSVSALALGSAGAGAFSGALTAPFWGQKLAKPGSIIIGFALSGAGILLLGGIGHIAAVLGVTFLGGYGGFLAKVAVDASLQEALPDDFRGRGFALYDILYNLASVVAAAVMLGAGSGSLRGPMLLAGGIAIAMAALLAAAMARAGLPLRRPLGAQND